MSQKTKVMNDPSFDLTLAFTVPLDSKLNRSPVAVHKTNISSSDSPYTSPNSSHPEGKSGDPEKLCPLQNKPHPFLKCRAFREKSLMDRKAYLKGNHICFRCCLSVLYLAKDCKVSVSCTECKKHRPRHSTTSQPSFLDRQDS